MLVKRIPVRIFSSIRFSASLAARLTVNPLRIRLYSGVQALDFGEMSRRIKERRKEDKDYDSMRSKSWKWFFITIGWWTFSYQKNWFEKNWFYYFLGINNCTVEMAEKIDGGDWTCCFYQISVETQILHLYSGRNMLQPHDRLNILRLYNFMLRILAAW